jgi:uncharacterized membrane protein YfcA
MVMVLSVLLLAMGAWFVIALARRVLAAPRDAFPPAEVTFVSGVINFFDTLGIGSFAPTTAYFKLRRLVADKMIPPTLIVGSAVPAILGGLIFIQIIEVDPSLLVACIAAAIGGSVLGASIAPRLPAQKIRVFMGVGLLIAACIMTLSNLNLMPAGGSALSLPPMLLMLAAAGCFVLGVLLNLGIGFYAPALIMLSLLGLEPRAAFPIMMGSCAFIFPSAGLKLLKHPDLKMSLVVATTVGAIPGILVAAFLVKSLPLELLRWLVILVVLYTSCVMLLAARRREEDLPGEASATA